MTPTKAFATCFAKTFTYSGRATRSEYWWFHFFVPLTLLGLFFLRSLLWEYVFPTLEGPLTLFVVIDKVVDLVTWAFILFYIVAQLSVGSRRLHDIGKSGWWQLLAVTGIGSVVLFIWYVTPSEKTVNKYGPVPTAI